MSEAARILHVDRLDARLVAHRWDYAQEKAAEMDGHWAARVAVNPALYDGPVLLARRAEVVSRDGARVLEIEAFETRFSRFLAWRDFGWADESVFNCFAMPAVRASDGAYLVGEMGPGHSAEGLRFFPGGTPDLSDVRADGTVDLAGSLWRELGEETGLLMGEGAPAPGWTVIFDRQRVACIKRIDWPAPGRAIRDWVRAWLAAEAAPELSDVHMLAPGRRDDPQLPAFMRDFLAFAARGASQSAAEFPDRSV